ncbi:unnamed protein product, partial [Urochloa humidicola]
ARACPQETGGLVGPLENGCRSAVAPPAAAAGRRAGCAASNCEAKAMPLSQYCFNHILLDPNSQSSRSISTAPFPLGKASVPYRSKDKFIRVWDLETQHCLHIVGGGEIWSMDVDFLPNIHNNTQ